MQTKSQLMAERLSTFVFVGGAATMFASLAFMAITKRIAIGVLVFASAGWVVFAVMNSVTLYTGEFRWKNGPIVTKQKSPVLFYIAWILFTAGSMAITTFFLLKAIQKIIN